MVRSSPNERFEAKDVLTILGILALGAIGYTYDQRSDILRWLLGAFGPLWLVAYVSLAGACLYGAVRHRSTRSWWGFALGAYLLLMPLITMLAATIYSALVMDTPVDH